MSKALQRMEPKVGQGATVAINGKTYSNVDVSVETYRSDDCMRSLYKRVSLMCLKPKFDMVIEIPEMELFPDDEEFTS